MQKLLGLSRYNIDEHFSLLIPAPAFLPPDNIPAAFDQLKNSIPTKADDIVHWFEDTYVHDYTVRYLPLFPPAFWSIADNMEYALPRMQNSVEAWHQRWYTLV